MKWLIAALCVIGIMFTVALFAAFESQMINVQAHIVTPPPTPTPTPTPTPRLTPVEVLHDRAETDSDPDSMDAASLDKTTGDTSDRWLVTLDAPNCPEAYDPTTNPQDDDSDVLPLSCDPAGVEVRADLMKEV